MGGIQLIVLGDFRQLPPVPSKWSQDAGRWVFESTNWSYVVPHVIQLQQVHRQNDSNFVEYINEVARGSISKECQAFMQSLNDEQDRKTHLFPKRINVDIHNAEKLKLMPGEIHYYDSREGMNISRKFRNSINVPHVLAFKENSPVILTVNLSEKLVNGLSGYVKSLDTSSVIVYFPRLKESKEIGYFDFYRYCHNSGHNVFICSQIPLILSFALKSIRHEKNDIYGDHVCL